MIEHVMQFKEFPSSAKQGILFLFLGWLTFYGVYFSMLDGEGLSEKQLAVGIICCGCLLLYKNWARVLCILCNIMAMFQFSFLTLAFFAAGKDSLGYGMGTVVILFGLSTFFLSTKKSAQCFKTLGLK